MKKLYSPLLDTGDFKQKFLKGHGDITAYIELRQPKTTSYQATLKGQQTKHKASITDYERQSCGIGGVIPDPQLMNSTMEKFAKYR